MPVRWRSTRRSASSRTYRAPASRRRARSPTRPPRAGRNTSGMARRCRRRVARRARSRTTSAAARSRSGWRQRIQRHASRELPSELGLRAAAAGVRKPWHATLRRPETSGPLDPACRRENGEAQDEIAMITRTRLFRSSHCKYQVHRAPPRSRRRDETDLGASGQLATVRIRRRFEATANQDDHLEVVKTGCKTGRPCKCRHCAILHIVFLVQFPFANGCDTAPP